jgi:hypothetical protein
LQNGYVLLIAILLITRLYLVVRAGQHYRKLAPMLGSVDETNVAGSREGVLTKKSLENL